ncbi:Rox3-domain-containing protein [Xylariaceae sp. FL0804]|nr:Rox3-domain-containing protein [Xylariaceae sp. FL0804]
MATMSFNPQTPQSPSQYSPSTTEQVASMNTSTTSIPTSLPTPAHSVNGSSHHHDSAQDTTITDDVSNKRKYPFDMEGNERKKAVLDDPRKIGISDLHLDVGEKYLLCRSPHSVSSPRMTEDLFEKFGLTGIAAEVARTKPNGEKNALRKTYKGQIKTLGLSGHFDVVKKEPSSFMALLEVADEDWQNRVVAGRDINNGFTSMHQAALSKATTMAKGPIPKSAWDSSVLGDLAPGNMPKKAPRDQVPGRTGPGTPVPSAAGFVPKPNRPLTPQLERARRVGAKRSYGDSTFEGYGEGFADDGYSTGEDRTKKKMKKVHPHPPSSINLG